MRRPGPRASARPAAGSSRRRRRRRWSGSGDDPAGDRPDPRGARRARGRCRSRPAAPGDRGQLLRLDPRCSVLHVRGARRRALEHRHRVGRPAHDHPARSRQDRRQGLVSAGQPPPARRPGEISLATRKRLFFGSGAVLTVFLVWAFAGMPGFGDYDGIYGLLLNHVAVPERHATNVITAVNFDYRGFDTLGEEFILFVAVLGMALLLRERRDEAEEPPDDDATGRQVRGASVIVRLITVVLVGPTVVLAVYIIAHGPVTPGGGFQGGVVAATALLMVYLGGEYVALRRVRPLPLVQLAESAGAGAFVLIGVGGLIASGAFLQNFLSLGTAGDVWSGGTIQILNVAVGLEVTGGFVLVISEFLDQTIVLRRKGRKVGL